MGGNIKMDITEIQWKGVGWTDLLQDGGKWA
jgi:hypothetical protein